jgi:hypothetical protein
MDFLRLEMTEDLFWLHRYIHETQKPFCNCGNFGLAELSSYCLLNRNVKIKEKYDCDNLVN